MANLPTTIEIDNARSLEHAFDLVRERVADTDLDASVDDSNGWVVEGFVYRFAGAWLSERYHDRQTPRIVYVFNVEVQCES